MSNSSNTGINLSALPDWAREVFSDETSTEPKASQNVRDFVGGPKWPALLSAAVVGYFLPRELVPSEGTTDKQRTEVEAAVLAFSERVNGADGPKWTLTQDARRSVLAAANEAEIKSAIDRTISHFFDPITVALRDQILGPSSNKQISGLSLRTAAGTLPLLEAARVAALWLGGTQNAEARKFEDLHRQVALRRFLKPFYRMVGVEEPEGTSVDLETIRFFGRDDQIAQLHDFVGGLLSNLRHRLLGPQLPLVVWGIGGVGKTTLVAKFVLEQAENANARYPFAYLDFDRNTLSARRPALLLAEMCQQITAQFPELTKLLGDLQTKARKLSAELDLSSEKASQEVFTFDRLGPLLEQFRNIVDSHISSLEGSWEFKRPFLLVLDTFEIVQYSDFDVACIERFVQKLSPSENNDGRGWARLRLIISGRKRPERFLKGFSEIELGALDQPGSVQMLQTLARDAGRPVRQEQAEMLIDSLVAAVGPAKVAGLSPLRLRLLGDVFKSSPEFDGNVIAQHLLSELNSSLGASAIIGKMLIDGVLIRRILDHVADWRVRLLADPGLVVRCISPAVIREVMARGTPKPSSNSVILDGDTEVFEPWDLTPGEADEIFSAFRSEVRLVEPDSSNLRHRQDVRQDMLPLIRARRPNRFMHLHRLAFAFFSSQVKLNLSDQSARAEAIYHGLWCGGQLAEIDGLWPKTMGFDARLDLFEFTDFPEARRYVLAKNRQPMPESDVAALPRSVAVEWTVARENTFLEDADPNKVARVVQAATGQSFEGLDMHVGTAATVARVLYRAGQWSESQRLIERHLVDTDGKDELMRAMTRGSKFSIEERDRLDDLLSLLRTWTTMSAKVGADAHPLEIAANASVSGELSVDAVTRIEMLSYAALGHRMLKERSEWSNDTRETVSRNLLRMALAVSESVWRQNPRALRYAILASDGDIGPLVACYFSTGDTSTLDREILFTAGRALSIAYDFTGDEHIASEIEKMAQQVQSSPEAAERLQALWREGRSRVVKIVRDNRELQSILKKIVVFDHHDWGRPFGHALTRLFEEKRGEALRDALRQERFVADPISRDSAFDGPSIVQWATARGNLLRLVETIEQFSDQYVSESAAGGSSGLSTDYPQSVFGIAEALLLWHDVHLEAAGGIEDEESEAKLDPDSNPVSRPKSRSKRPKAPAKKKKRDTKRLRKKK